MKNNLIDSGNAGPVMAWCSVITLIMGVGMTIYQLYNQYKQQEAVEEAMKSLPTSNG